MQILIVEDHPLFARALKDEIMNAAASLNPRVDLAGSRDSAVALASAKSYDLAFIDLKVPGANGLSLLRAIQRAGPTKVAVITASDDPFIVRAIFAERAFGYLWKAAPADRFREDLYLLLAGAAVFPDYVYTRSSGLPSTVLTDRELGVLRHLVDGLQNKEIARELGVTVATIKTHVKNVFSKLGVRSRLAAASKARDLGLLAERGK